MPVFAAIIGISGALATNVARPFATNYWVASTDGTDYVLTPTQPSGCGSGENQVCQISTETTPVNNRVPTSQASIEKRRP